MQIVKISSQKSYEVQIGQGLLDSLGERVRKLFSCDRAIIISDDIVYNLYGKRCEESLKSAGFKLSSYVFAHGEESKSLTEYGAILEFLSSEKISRADVLIALGGGVVGDITGFVASTYLRGIPFVQVPTTLLAAVDSSVGGKTAINLSCGNSFNKEKLDNNNNNIDTKNSDATNLSGNNLSKNKLDEKNLSEENFTKKNLGGKNLVGAFYQPSLVVCDYDLLGTLSEDIMRDGTAEVIKYGAIMNKNFYEQLNTPVTEQLEDIISQCVGMKESIVKQDEHDQGIRQLLNFGHTFGHAIETISNYSISHGYAVAMGMALMAKVSYLQKWCSLADYENLCTLLKNYGFSLTIPYKAEELFEIMLMDKKRKNESITIVIMQSLGNCQLKKVSMSELKELLMQAMQTI